MRRLPGAFLAAALVASIALVSCSSQGGDQPTAIPGAKLITFTVGPGLVPESLDEEALRLPPPADGSRRALLVLLHGRGGSPDSWANDHLYDALKAAGDLAPDVVMANGGDASYWHDRSDGRWGTYVVREVIPRAIRLLHADPNRIAIGGISMGGFGALDIARLHPGMFCAVGGHSAAIFATAGNTTQGSFDDAEDFAKHDLVTWAKHEQHPFAGTPVWMDVGADDPFHDADVEVAHELQANGANVSLHIFPGGHDWDYWNAHTPDYVRFYAAALREC